MSWYNTPAKFKEPAAADEEEAEEEPEEEAEEDEEPEENAEEEDKEEPLLDKDGEPIERKTPIFFKESDYHLRVPHERYQYLKTLETLALSSPTT